MYDVWIYADVNGNIVSSYGGHETYSYLPEEDEASYNYYFKVEAAVFKNIPEYTVINGALIPKEV